ncbi:DUF1272 domain-containing protein [Litorimonas sp. RW-G-Af-16]|uniref:DUF1272 domain-containing protein n=1 Tax=Litorimonas sp. RW-G-Af-16 TaxID=3241168 RepID=UPI00390C4DBE
MLQMRPNCELCDCDLPADKAGAMICSFECTFCADCVSGPCPNCGGDLRPRPTRTGKVLERYPASTKRVLKST